MGIKKEVKTTKEKRVFGLNQHIQSHYRPQELPWALCMRSIFQWNNETLNVWSHLLGFVWFSYLQNWTLFDALPAVNAPASDYWVMGVSMLCCQLCMLLSSAYHIFGCHSPQRRKQWLRADLFGVSAGLTGLYMTETAKAHRG
uniref:Progestin and adipoQ receptor family member 3 n=1 Tax=Globodera pallida TaxID=36090 RepID=A0A183BTC8_GLOPA